MTRENRFRFAIWAGLLGLILAVACLVGAPVRAQDLSALARTAGPAQVQAGWRSLTLTLPLTQPVPWRTRLIADPPRALIDFRTVDWTGFDPAAVPLEGAVQAIRVGDAGGGWSRMVIELDRPMGFSEAGLTSDPATGAAELRVVLRPVSETDFAAQMAALAATDGAPTDVLRAETGPPLGQRRTVVVLDPGHGGVDPGASYDGVSEAQVVLTFALELAEELRRTGRYDVVLTRDTDRFISLEGRITVAHEARADVFVSLHADAVEDGQAVGATLYTLAEEATDAAGAALAERHDRDDLLGGGVDLTGTDDSVATVLMEMARVQTGPATDRLARALVGAIRSAGLRMHRHPWQQAAFSVLKSPSVPSALLEVGFLSSSHDRGRIRDVRWRRQMEAALVQGLDAWVAGEVAQQGLRLR